MYEKLPVMTFQAASHLLDFVKGKTREQVERRLQRIYSESHDEALDLDRRHKALVDNVVQASSTLDKAVRALSDFEQTILGMSQHKEPEKKDSNRTPQP